MDAYEKFEKAINELSPTPENLIKQLYGICVERKFKKGDHFVTAGEIPKYMGFNLDGLFRLYYIDRNGNDFTKGFSYTGLFLVSYSAIVQRRPSFFNIEAIQDSHILMYDFDNFQQMIREDLRWYPFVFKLLEKVYIMKELREKSFLLNDAAQRYQEFKDQYSHIEDQIMLYHVASFLGITPEALSRIRSRNNY